MVELLDLLEPGDDRHHYGLLLHQAEEVKPDARLDLLAQGCVYELELLELQEAPLEEEYWQQETVDFQGLEEAVRPEQNGYDYYS